RADPGFRPEGLGFDGIQLSLARPLPAGLVEPALLKRQQRADIFRLRSAGDTRLGSVRSCCPKIAAKSPHRPPEASADRDASPKSTTAFFSRSKNGTGSRLPTHFSRLSYPV